MNQFKFLSYLTVYLKSDDIEGVATFIESERNIYLVTTEEVARKTSEASVTLYYKKKRAVYQTTLDLKLDWRFFYDSNLAYCDIKEIQKVVKALFGGKLYFSSIKRWNIHSEADYREAKDYLKTSIIGYIYDNYPIPVAAQGMLKTSALREFPVNPALADTPILPGSPILIRNEEKLIGFIMNVVNTDECTGPLSVIAFADDLLNHTLMLFS